MWSSLKVPDIFSTFEINFRYVLEFKKMCHQAQINIRVARSTMSLLPILFKVEVLTLCLNLILQVVSFLGLLWLFVTLSWIFYIGSSNNNINKRRSCRNILVYRIKLFVKTLRDHLWIWTLWLVTGFGCCWTCLFAVFAYLLK